MISCFTNGWKFVRPFVTLQEKKLLLLRVPYFGYFCYNLRMNYYAVFDK